jgi:hypothetical protein
MWLLHLFEWLGATPVGVFIQQSTYAFEVLEMLHLLSLAILGGAILLIDLRLIGFGLVGQSAVRVAGELRPFVVGGLSASMVSGVLLVAGEPMKCYYNPAFRWKMLFLGLAVLFYFVVQQRLLQNGGRELLTKWAAVISLLLWLAVGLAGRAIGVI